MITIAFVFLSCYLELISPNDVDAVFEECIELSNSTIKDVTILNGLKSQYEGKCCIVLETSA
jgi:hypothetical protein